MALWVELDGAAIPALRITHEKDGIREGGDQSLPVSFHAHSHFLCRPCCADLTFAEVWRRVIPCACFPAVLPPCLVLMRSVSLIKPGTEDRMNEIPSLPYRLGTNAST